MEATDPPDYASCFGDDLVSLAALMAFSALMRSPIRDREVLSLARRDSPSPLANCRA